VLNESVLIGVVFFSPQRRKGAKKAQRIMMGVEGNEGSALLRGKMFSKLPPHVKEEPPPTLGIEGIFQPEHGIIRPNDVNPESGAGQKFITEPFVEIVIGIISNVADIGIGLQVNGKRYVPELGNGHSAPVIGA
jgi:hypothetical protein